METRTQNGGVGGSSSGGLLRALRDGGGGVGRPQAGDSSEALREQPVLSLDQIRSVRTSNEYTEGPTVAPPRPLSAHEKLEVVPGTGSAAQSPSLTQSESALEQPQQQQQRAPQRASTYPQPTHLAPRDAPSRTASAESSRAPSARTSTDSGSSDQRLLGGSPVTPERVVRAQPPKRSEVKLEDLKPLASSAPGGGGGGDAEGSGKHAYHCEDCGRCKCKECAGPRRLPACWLCGQRCLCSAESAVEYGTCVCCVKGLFYHCSTDDEDTCADKPFSCSQAHCCARWSALGALTLLLPCLLCYLPARGCLALCQACYHCGRRPGCRCRNAGAPRCKNVDKPT